MKARAYKKKSIRECRLAKSLSAREAIGPIKKGQDVFVLTFGQFSLIDAMVHIIDEVGPASVDFSTWTAAEAHLYRSMELMEAAKITRFRLLVDHSFEGRQPEYCATMRNLFGVECIRTLRTHAKFMVIRSATHDVVVRTSMNLNENPRLENIEVSEDRAFAEFFEGIMDEVFMELGEGERRSKLMQLKGLPENSPFELVHANQIEREKLNEPKRSHVVQKL